MGQYPAAFGEKYPKSKFSKALAPLKKMYFGQGHWNTEILKDLDACLDGNIEVISFNDSVPNYYKANAIILLGGRLFNTRVNVHCMECMDIYFTHPEDKPSFWELEKHFCTYNVFNNQSDRPPHYDGRFIYPLKNYLIDSGLEFKAKGSAKPGWGRPLSDRKFMNGILYEDIKEDPYC